jgi:hypothetical protein
MGHIAADAMHMASLLVQYGYLFPVIEQSSQVKDDNSLYRVQIPYFWASHVGKADNVEYGMCMWHLTTIKHIDCSNLPQ